MAISLKYNEREQYIVIPRHAACRGISPIIDFKHGEIPHSVRNDTVNRFARTQLSSQ
jgi:hypothetical protein